MYLALDLCVWHYIYVFDIRFVCLALYVCIWHYIYVFGIIFMYLALDLCVWPYISNSQWSFPKPY